MTFAARTLMDSAAGSGPPPSHFVPVTRSYPSPGSFVETIPGNVATGIGPSSLTIENAGPGGGGAQSAFYASNGVIAGSGGSGALCRSVFPISSSDWGATFRVVVAPGGVGGNSSNFNGQPLAGSTPPTSIITNISFTRAVNMQAGGGFGGTWNPGAGGAGGTSTGGNAVNASGNVGQGDTYAPNPSVGGPAVQGQLIVSGAGGNSGATNLAPGTPGDNGAAAFAYT